VNYVSLELVRHVAAQLAEADVMGHEPICGFGASEEPLTRVCRRPGTHLIPSTFRPFYGHNPEREATAIRQHPRLICREHLEELLGYPPEENTRPGGIEFRSLF
jgi:hypothetical protein